MTIGISSSLNFKSLIISSFDKGLFTTRLVIETDNDKTRKSIFESSWNWAKFGKPIVTLYLLYRKKKTIFFRTKRTKIQKPSTSTTFNKTPIFGRVQYLTSITKKKKKHNKNLLHFYKNVASCFSVDRSGNQRRKARVQQRSIFSDWNSRNRVYLRGSSFDPNGVCR